MQRSRPIWVSRLRSLPLFPRSLFLYISMFLSFFPSLSLAVSLFSGNLEAFGDAVRTRCKDGGFMDFNDRTANTMRGFTYENFFVFVFSCSLILVCFVRILNFFFPFCFLMFRRVLYFLCIFLDQEAVF